MRVALLELELRMAIARERDHRFGDVDPEYRRSASGRLGGRIAGTAGNVEHADLRPDARSVQ